MAIFDCGICEHIVIYTSWSDDSIIFITQASCLGWWLQPQLIHFVTQGSGVGYKETGCVLGALFSLTRCPAQHPLFCLWSLVPLMPLFRRGDRQRRRCSGYSPWDLVWMMKGTCNWNLGIFPTVKSSSKLYETLLWLSHLTLPHTCILANTHTKFQGAQLYTILFDSVTSHRWQRPKWIPALLMLNIKLDHSFWSFSVQLYNLMHSVGVVT